MLSPPTCEVFKNKIQPSTSEDLTGFTKGFNNIPCSEEGERKTHKMEGFYKGCGEGRSISKRKEGLFQARTTSFFREGLGRVFIMQITSLVLIRKFQIDC